ncbi:MAG: helix-turn-helix domain-containing protein [Comamonas sp.]
MKENFSSLFGGRLKDARTALGLSQAEAAALAFVTREQWGRYERGLAVPGGEVLSALWGAGVDVAYVLTGTRDPAAPTLDPAEQVLLDSYRRASPQAKANLIQTAALLAAGLAGTSGKTSSKPPGSMSITGSGNGHVQVGSTSGDVYGSPARAPRKTK